MTFTAQTIQLLMDGTPRTSACIAQTVGMRPRQAYQTCHHLEKTGQITNVRSGKGPKVYVLRSDTEHKAHHRNQRAIAMIDNRLANHPQSDAAWLNVLRATLKGER